MTDELIVVLKSAGLFAISWIVVSVADIWVERIFSRHAGDHGRSVGPRHEYVTGKLHHWFWSVAFNISAATILTWTWQHFHYDVIDRYLVCQCVLGLTLVCIAGWHQYRALGLVIRWDCEHCGKRLESNVPWVCGSCNRTNDKTSLLRQCRGCKATPRAFECYHCGNCTFFFEGDDDDRACARRVSEPKPGETIEQARAREISEREHQKRMLELQIELKQLQARLEPSAQPKSDVRQQRMDWCLRQMEDAELDCRTITETVSKEKLMLEQIDSDKKLDESLKSQIKKIISRKFEDLRGRLGGGDIRL